MLGLAMLAPAGALMMWLRVAGTSRSDTATLGRSVVVLAAIAVVTPLSLGRNGLESDFTCT